MSIIGIEVLSNTLYILQEHLEPVNHCAILSFLRRRGSTGFGQDSVESLPGKIGTNDVADVMAALAAVERNCNSSQAAVQ